MYEPSTKISLRHCMDWCKSIPPPLAHSISWSLEPANGSPMDLSTAIYSWHYWILSPARDNKLTSMISPNQIQCVTIRLHGIGSTEIIPFRMSLDLLFHQTIPPSVPSSFKIIVPRSVVRIHRVCLTIFNIYSTFLWTNNWCNLWIMTGKFTY